MRFSPLVFRHILMVALCGSLAACGGFIPAPSTGSKPVPRQPVPPKYPKKPLSNQPSTKPSVAPSSAASDDREKGGSALALGLRSGPDMASFGLTNTTAAPALASFRESCPKLLARNDPSGVTRNADWQGACDAANSASKNDAAQFFADYFETAVVGDGATYITGYYEPEISGVRNRAAGFDVPVYKMPPDLVHARAGDAPVRPNGQTPFGRYDADGRFVGYYSRAEIDGGILAGKGLELGWAADPVEFFFLQIQGSGRLRAPDGTVMRIGYAADNGLNYTSIGRIMREKGLIGTESGQYPGSMQGIMRYVRDNPEAGRALLAENKSWVFFREMSSEGPIGAMGVPVRAHVSLAADPLFVPLGAPVFLTGDRQIVDGLWVVQDTGGGIKGANRFDTFWGAGNDARTTAGGMASRGQAVIFLPKGTLARLGVK
ncbi:MAG: hypothetical protein RLY97_1842 [Pseudomonadota bacterium]|jgi:membrane-bound lytic murein transglycosylase A